MKHLFLILKSQPHFIAVGVIAVLLLLFLKGSISVTEAV